MSKGTNDPQIDIPAPKAIAKYIYDNQQHNLSLQTQMGLQDDRETLTDMIVAARRAASSRLVLDVPTYREQRPETLATITDEVMKECTEIRKYRDGWPVSRYIHIYLKNYRVGGKNGHKKAVHVKSIADSRTRPGPGRHSAGFTATRDISAEQKPVGPNPMSKGKRSRDRAETYKACPSRPIASTPGALGAIASFLNGLKLPARDAERIAVLLQDMGVENEDYLEILATLEMRDQWLEELGEEGDLTPIQVRLLKEGLDRLGMGAK